MNTKTKKTDNKNVNGGAFSHLLIDRVQVVKSRRAAGRFCVIVRVGESWTTPAEIDITELPKEDIKIWKRAEGETTEDGAFINFGRICSILGIALGDETIKRIKKHNPTRKNALRKRLKPKRKSLKADVKNLSRTQVSAPENVLTALNLNGIKRRIK